MTRALRFCFIFALLAVSAFAQTAATRATLYTEIDTLFADTGSDPITPAQLRQSLKNITVSSANLLSDTTLTVLDGFTISSAGSIALTAGGTNESITLTPSGTGGVSMLGNSGVAGGGINDTIAFTIGSPAVSTGTNAYGAYGASTAPAGVTGTFSQFYSNPRTAAGLASTLISQFRATSVSLGSGSTVATLEGFSATNTLTQGTVNYGFRGQLAASGTARYNLYMDGTAPNYLAGAVTLGSTINKLTLTPPATGSTLTIADGKTLTASNTLTLTATDGSTLAVGAGGTLGTAAYTAASAYATSAQGTKADNVGAVNGLVKSNGSASFSAASAGTDYVVPAGNVATATALATPRAIYGNNFDGSAALTQVIASTYGGTGNGFAKFSGPTTSEKTFTLPNSSATLLYAGGDAGTPSALVLTNATALPAAQVVAGALADGMTATTQTVGDNDTSLATTAFANTAAKATKLGSHASPDTTGGSITWATSAVYEVWTNTTTTYALPAASGYDGKAVIFYVTGTNAITIDPNSSEVIVRDGTAQTGGVTLTLAGVAGNYVCLICDGTRWISLGYKGVLAAGS